MVETLSPTTEEATRMEEELYGCAMLDTGCTANVAGEGWIQQYMEGMSQEEEAKVGKKETSEKSFKFGDGETLPSVGSMKLPIRVGNKNHSLNLDVVKSPIPLLMSLKSMKTLQLIIMCAIGEVTSDGVNCGAFRSGVDI